MANYVPPTHLQEKNLSVRIALLRAVIVLTVLLTCSTFASGEDGRGPDPAAAAKFYKTGGTLAQVGRWGSYEYATGGLYDIQDCAVHPDGTLYFAQFEALDEFSRVQHFSADGDFINWFGGYYGGVAKDEYLTEPHGIAYSPDNKIVVTQYLSSTIKSFNPDGTFHSKITGDNTPYYNPTKVACDGQGDIYYVDSKNTLVHKFSSSGTKQWTYSEESSSPNDRFVPHSVAVHPDGRVFISDNQRSKIIVLNSKGKKESEFGKAGTAPGDIQAPTKIAFGPDDNLYIRSWHQDPQNKSRRNSRISCFDADGIYLSHVDISWPDEVYQGWVWLAEYIAVGPDNRVYVTRCNSDQQLAFVLEFTPERYKPLGKKGTFLGKIKGLKANEMKNITVRIEGAEKGQKFYASVRPTSKGRYKVKGFPQKVDYTLSLVGFNTIEYTCKPLVGKSQRKNKINITVKTAD